MTSRQPTRKLSDVLVRTSAEARARQQQAYRDTKLRSSTLFGGTRKTLPANRRHAEVFVSPHGIAPLRSEPWHGYWFLHKPAFIPVLHPSGKAKGDVASNGTCWSIERFLREAPLVRATFDKGEKLHVLHGLATNVSGILPIATDLPADVAGEPEALAAHGLVSDERFEFVVWGHLQKTVRPVKVDGITLSDFAASKPSPVIPAGPLPELPPEALHVSVPAVGYYCGHPASVVVVRATAPDVRTLGSVNWAELVAQLSARFVPTAGSRTVPPAPSGAGSIFTDLPKATDDAGRPLLVGDAVDTFGTQLKLQLPRTMVNLFATTVRPLNAEEPSFEADEPMRFPKLLSTRPPLADPFAARQSRRRVIV